MSFSEADSTWEFIGQKLFKFGQLSQKSPGIPLQKECFRMRNCMSRSYEEDDREADRDCRSVEKMTATGESVGRLERIQPRRC